LPVFGLLSALTAAQSVAMMMLQAAHVVVLKKERRLELLSEGKLIKTYKVALGSDPIGPQSRFGKYDCEPTISQ
jgi:murein L,D-transpeptidase YafK